MNGKLSEHFSLDEVTFSETAIRLGLDNTPPEELMPNIERMAKFMEQVRYVLSGRPIHISSWYRSPEINKMVGGSSTSVHTRGLACDFQCQILGSPYRVTQELINSNLDFDQIILEGVSKDYKEGRWVHIGLSEGHRRQVLTAFFPGPRYYPDLLLEEPT